MDQEQRFIDVQNVSAVPQQVWINGQRHLLPPGGVVELPAAVAEEFLRLRTPYVKRADCAVVPDVPGERMYVANVSGAPTQQKSFQTEVYNKRTDTYVTQEIRNELVTPTVFAEYYPVGQERITLPSGEAYDLNVPDKPLIIPAYTVVRVAEPVAKWAIAVCQQRMPERRHHLTIVRNYPSFQPSEGWDYAELLHYAHLVTDGVFQTRHELPTVATFGAFEGQQKLETLRTALKALYFYIVDDRYSKPAQRDFEESLSQRPRKGTNAKG